jgi:hypothetical protein
VLCHELAHIYLGHLGANADGWWPARVRCAEISKPRRSNDSEAFAYERPDESTLIPPSTCSVDRENGLSFPFLAVFDGPTRRLHDTTSAS